jgi:hypothetical protein
MLRVFAAFLLVFSLLGLVVQLDGPVQLFGGAALVLFGIDLLQTNFASRPPTSRTGRESLL